MRKHLAAITFLTIALGLSAAYFAISPTPTTKLFLYNAVGLLSVGAVLYSVRRNRPARRLPWLMFAAGLGSFLIADVIYYVLETNSPAVPFPSIADLFYLLMYPLVGVGLCLKIRDRSQVHRDWASLIDAGIFGIAVFSVLWVVVMDSYVDPTVSSQATIERAISLAYPVADVAVLFLAVRLAVSINRRHTSLWLIVGSLTMLVMADVQYGVLSAANEFETGSHVDAFWLAFYVLFGLGALLHSPTEPPVPPLMHQRLTNGRLALMFVATVTVPIIDLSFGTPRDRLVTLTSAAILFALVLVRALGLVRIVENGQELLREEARRDPLTGLANRTRFAELTEQALARPGVAVAVLFVDLDDFKTINDSLGHAAGDELLSLAAERLSRCIREHDLVARLGGDEFAVLLTSSVDQHDAATTARRILGTLAEPARIQSRSVRIDASIGVAMRSRDNDDVASMLRAADAAMYLAKRQGKGRFEFFDQTHFSEAMDRLELKADLEGALARGELEIYYQPIVATGTGVVRSVEALLRWRHPERGMVPPDRFIPLAEETGLITSIGSWVLVEACKQVRHWETTVPHCRELSASVNLSARQLRDPGVLETITEALRGSGLAPDRLVIEVTESLLVSDKSSDARVLEQLKALRVRIAIDDFGTGYSSLSYLHSFPVDTIKIDRAFITKLDQSATSIALVRTVIDLARAVGATTVAEGVETQRQLDLLANVHCDLVQGFLHSRPMPPEQVTEFLTRRNSGTMAVPLPERCRATLPSGRPGPAEFAHGTRRLEPFLDGIARLHRAVEMPVTARWPWLAAWDHVHPETEVRAVVVPSPDRRRIDGAAILGVTRIDGVAHVASLGDVLGTVPSIAARDERAADALAQGIADLVTADNGPWYLRLDQVAARDDVVSRLADRLPGASFTELASVPRVDASLGRDTRDLLSRNTRKQLRRAEARLRAAGVDVAIEQHRDASDITRLLPEVEAAHIQRDHHRRSQSDLDDTTARRFWQEVIVAHAATGELELSILRFDGTLAAYVIALLDGTSYRILDGRMNSGFAGYSPGRLLESAVLERTLADPVTATFDWMTGVAPDTILAANRWQRRWQFTAGSREVAGTRREATPGPVRRRRDLLTTA